MKIGEIYATFAVIFVLLVISNGMEHGERCQTPDRTSGTCIRIKECPSLVGSITVKPIPESTLDLLNRSQCGLQGTNLLVCCPSNSPLVSLRSLQPMATTTNTEITEDVSRHRNLVEHGERCQTPDRTSGTCILIKECPSLVGSIVKPIPESTIDLLNRSRCGEQGTNLLVCCPSNSPLVSLRTLQPMETTTNTEVTEDVSRHRNLGLLQPKICGPMSDVRIINGNKTKLNEMPWMALINYTVDRGSPQRCGGTIINNRYVLTAAHCVKLLPWGVRPISVRLGEHDLDSKKDCEDDPDGEEGEKKCAPAPQDFQIEEIAAHPNYKGRPNFQNDIALIRLSKAADFSSDYVRPICLPIGLQEQTHKLNSGKVTVAGWGITENDTVSPVLLKVAVTVKPHDQCVNAYKETVSLSAVSQLCAGGEDGSDSCYGDSGGPLTYFGNVHGSPRIIQHGVVSFGPKKCGTQGKPVIYTRVGYLMNWILDNLKP